MKSYEDCIHEAARFALDSGIDPRNQLVFQHANLLFKSYRYADQAKYAAVVAELECASNDIQLRDKEIAERKYQHEIAIGRFKDSQAIREEMSKEIAALKAECERQRDINNTAMLMTPQAKAEAIRALEEKVHDGQIKVRVSATHHLCEWVDAGEWLLSEAAKLEQGND